MPTAHDFSATTLDGREATLDEFRGRTMLIVNVASKCGFTPQYSGLESLHRKYRDEGLAVLGFPCDQFAHQEPGDADEIRDFCSTTYDVTFPMFAKIDVNGDDTHPLYEWLKREQRGMLGGRIKWNFTKFLVDPQGAVVDRFGPRETPEKIEPKVAEVLARGRE